jgi:hypothetical protein
LTFWLMLIYIKKNNKQKNFEKSKSVVWIRGSGSVAKCHVSTTLFFYTFCVFIYGFYFVFLIFINEIFYSVL